MRFIAPLARDLSRVWRVLVGDYPPIVRESSHIVRRRGASTHCRTIDNRHGCFAKCALVCWRVAKLRKNRLNVNPGSTGARRSVFPCLKRCCKFRCNAMHAECADKNARSVSHLTFRTKRIKTKRIARHASQATQHAQHIIRKAHLCQKRIIR